MAEENAFARILNRMSAAESGITEKTAGATNTPEPDAAARMLSTVRAVTSSVKTAAVVAPTPKASLEKMAAEAQQAEETQLLKQAQFMGAALADGFMERFAQYDAALSTVKVAEGEGEDPRASGPGLGHYLAGGPLTGAYEAGEGNRMRGFGTGIANHLKESLIGAGAGGLGGAALGALISRYGLKGSAGDGAAVGGGLGSYLGAAGGGMHSTGTTYREVTDPAYKTGSQADLQKVAQAAYTQAVQDMEKKAAIEFDAGYNDQLAQIHKVASDVHFIGQQTASALIQQARTAK